MKKTVVLCALLLSLTSSAMAQAQSFTPKMNRIEPLEIYPIVIDGAYSQFIFDNVYSKTLPHGPMTTIYGNFAKALDKLDGKVWIDMTWMRPQMENMDVIFDWSFGMIDFLYSMQKYCEKNKGTIYINSPHIKDYPAENVFKDTIENFGKAPKIDDLKCVKLVSVSFQEGPKLRMLKTNQQRPFIALESLNLHWNDLSSLMKNEKIEESQVSGYEDFEFEVIRDEKKDSYLSILEVDTTLDDFSNYGNFVEASNKSQSMFYFLTASKWKRKADGLTIIAMQNQKTDVHTILVNGEEKQVPGYFVNILAIRTIEKMLKEKRK